MEMYTEHLDKSKTVTFKNGMKLVVSYGTRNDDGVCDWDKERIFGQFRRSILYDENGGIIEKLIEPNPFVDWSYEEERYHDEGNNHKSEKIYFNNGMRATFDYAVNFTKSSEEPSWGFYDNNHGDIMRVLLFDEFVNIITEQYMENNVVNSPENHI